MRSYGAAAPIFFILVYAAAVAAFVPASPLTVVGGAIFGLLRGILYSMAGATLGSSAAFLVGRYLARDAVARQLDRMPRLAAIDRAVSLRGRRIVFLLRLSPFVPFNVLNYALGLTTISWRDFALATCGMLPGSFVYAYVGKMAGEALAIAGEAGPPRNASYYGALAAGLVVTVGATIVITRTARRALRDV